MRKNVMVTVLVSAVSCILTTLSIYSYFYIQLNGLRSHIKKSFKEIRVETNKISSGVRAYGEYCVQKMSKLKAELETLLEQDEKAERTCKIDPQCSKEQEEIVARKRDPQINLARARYSIAVEMCKTFVDTQLR